jgi:mRNA interferase YafQ
MLEVSYTTQFKKDYKLCKKRGYDMKQLAKIIDILAIPKELPVQNRDHNLIGNYANKRECHIQSDWLLVYRVEGERLVLYRTGTHTDMFNK